MEDIVSCETLVVRNELDVLQSIISWLEAKNRLENNTENDVLPIATTNIGNARKLTKHLNVNGLHADVLRQVARLADEWILHELAKRCFQAFLNNEVTLPIPASIRVARKRNVEKLCMPPQTMKFKKGANGEFERLTFGPTFNEGGKTIWALAVKISEEAQGERFLIPSVWLYEPSSVPHAVQLFVRV